MKVKKVCTIPELFSRHSQAAVGRKLFIPIHEVYHPLFFSVYMFLKEFFFAKLKGTILNKDRNVGLYIISAIHNTWSHEIKVVMITGLDNRMKR